MSDKVSVGSEWTNGPTISAIIEVLWPQVTETHNSVVVSLTADFTD